MNNECSPIWSEEFDFNYASSHASQPKSFSRRLTGEDLIFKKIIYGIRQTVTIKWRVSPDRVKTNASLWVWNYPDALYDHRDGNGKSARLTR